MLKKRNLKVSRIPAIAQMDYDIEFGPGKKLQSDLWDGQANALTDLLRSMKEFWVGSNHAVWETKNVSKL